MPRTLPPEVVDLIEKNRLLSMAVVAQILGVPIYTAREWARRGVFPTVVPPGTRRRFVRAKAFFRWLREHEQK